MKKIFFIFILFILLGFKIVLDIRPMSPPNYYTEKTFKKLIDNVIKNKDNISLEELILYCNRNNDSKKEKIYNLSLLMCYIKSSKIEVLQDFLDKNIYLNDFNVSHCSQKPLSELKGNFSIIKYIWYMFEFNEFPK